ncbi:ATP-binding protein [Sutcliffiella horikoshii]|uniref:hybrid sensor histidine kinase/response regulator n=1 Tax=Sutcliffiella horikoshii TaxID=79883 RepID=UPI001F41025E|nr:response regulator [Sutcliffiella horikoshii]
MSFKKKQFVGLGITVFFLMLLLSVILFMTNSMKTNMLEIVEDRYYKVNKATDIRQLFYETDRQLLFVTNRNDGENIESNLTNIAENREAVRNNIIELESVLDRNDTKLLLSKIQEGYNSYWIMEQEIIAQINEGASTGELQGIYASQLDTRAELLQSISEFKTLQETLMEETMGEASQTYQTLVFILIAAVLLSLIVIVSATLWVIRSTNRRLDEVKDGIKGINYDDLSTLPRLSTDIKDEIGEISLAFNGMASSIESYHVKEKQFTEEIGRQNWVQTNSADIINLYHRNVSTDSLAEKFIATLTPLMDAKLGAFYLLDGENGEGATFKKVATYADGAEDVGGEEYKLREGLVGQCAWDKKVILLEEVPENYSVVTTGIGHIKPRSIIIAPVIIKDEVIAVIEMATLTEFTKTHRQLLDKVLETLGIAITNILGRMEVERLLLESQAQTEELQSQSEELQAQSEELQTQSEELRMINEQLEERSRDAEQKSADLQKAKTELEEKAKQLQLSSKYKSEFLANMSHELRTPLNSILLLSEMLAEDPEDLLTDEQREFSRVINSSGQDLLNLINDILDLSKVEVKKLEVMFGEVNVEEFINRLELQFTHIAKHKKLDYEIVRGNQLPDVFFTDEQRLQQIVKNLLSNAFKFTEKGKITVKIEKAPKRDLLKANVSVKAESWLKISVEDTGIGISKDKQSLIFEAFHQGDGATMRKYGGTGLGLSISKEFSNLLGGRVFVESEEGEGSVFTLLIPSLPEGMPQMKEVEAAWQEVASTTETDLMEEENMVLNMAEKKEVVQPEPVEEQDISNILKGKTVVVVDDDHRNVYALNNALNKEDMNILTAENGLQCLDILHENEHVDIILMDIMMPVMDGYKAIKTIRNLEKHKDVPIIALTAKAMKGDREKCLEVGASDYISKPLKLDQLLSAMRVWVAKN